MAGIPMLKKAQEYRFFIAMCLADGVTTNAERCGSGARAYSYL